jgi:hypothetical protein
MTFGPPLPPYLQRALTTARYRPPNVEGIRIGMPGSKEAR